MPEVSLTKWMDPLLKWSADQTGIPVEQFSPMVGGEGIGVGLEVISDIFTKGWLNKLIQGAAGGLGLVYILFFGRKVPMRLKRELLAICMHESLRVVDPKPSDIAEFKASVEESVRAWVRKDWNAFLAAVLRTPTEIQSMLGVAQLTPTGQDQSPSKGSYEVSPPPKPKQPARTSPMGSYRMG